MLLLERQKVIQFAYRTKRDGIFNPPVALQCVLRMPENTNSTMLFLLFSNSVLMP